jgi:hypothetical protein
MPYREQTFLLAIGSSYYVLNVALAIRRCLGGSGMSPGSFGAFIPLLMVLFAQPWPLWLRLVLAPVVVLLEFSWIAVYWILERRSSRDLISPPRGEFRPAVAADGRHTDALDAG